jgi:lysophospholipase L1-like esterase
MRQQTIAATLGVLLLLVASGAAFAVQIGVVGDSISDEYFDGEAYGAYSDNWTEQLVTYRGVDMGPTGAWGGPRRNGYEYNWARAGATSTTLLSAGQHTGLAAQVVPKDIDYAVMMIGANDQFAFAGNDPYTSIYLGTYTPAQTTAWVNGVVTNINTALATLVPTGVKMVLASAPDYGITPGVQALATSASGRQAVRDVIANQLNPQIEALAQAYNLPYVDLRGSLEAIFGPHNSLNSTVKIGNVDIFLQQSDTPTGTNLTAGFVNDAIHPHTTLQGVFANLVMEGLNIGYGANLSLFSETEILAHRGISYGGSDTLAAQIGPYSDYIVNYVPEPSSLVLATLAIAALAIVTLRRRKAA